MNNGNKKVKNFHSSLFNNKCDIKLEEAQGAIVYDFGRVDDCNLHLLGELELLFKKGNTISICINKQ